MPGTDLVSGPSDVTVGGYPAKHVVINVREDIGAHPEKFYLWCARPPDLRATPLGGTTSGLDRRCQRDAGLDRGETYKGAGPEPGQEIQRMVDSIQFE